MQKIRHCNSVFLIRHLFFNHCFFFTAKPNTKQTYSLTNMLQLQHLIKDLRPYIFFLPMFHALVNVAFLTTAVVLAGCVYSLKISKRQCFGWCPDELDYNGPPPAPRRPHREEHHEQDHYKSPKKHREEEDEEEVDAEEDDAEEGKQPPSDRVSHIATSGGCVLMKKVGRMSKRVDYVNAINCPRSGWKTINGEPITTGNLDGVGLKCEEHGEFSVGVKLKLTKALGLKVPEYSCHSGTVLDTVSLVMKSPAPCRWKLNKKTELIGGLSHSRGAGFKWKGGRTASCDKVKSWR